jgi:hypothetical protein
MSQTSYPDLMIADLQPGDVCLMMSSGQLSKLISWVGDSPYSHAFLIYDNSQLIEAALSGLRLYPIAERLADTTEVLLIDVYRPSTVSGHPFGPAEISAMQATAKEFVGLPYARNALVDIAMMSALRNKLPDSETLRWVLRVAMSHAVKDDPSTMMCSELVYRILQQAGTIPAGSLRPTIISAFRSHAPLPPIDVKALLKELEQIFVPPKASTSVSNTNAPPPPLALPTAQSAGLTAYQNQEPVGGELSDLADALRAKHLPPQASAPVLIVPDPNPKTVFPVDLATSPSLRFIGRMAKVVATI